MPSVKKNFFWSSILTASGYLSPLITYPYVTRVLGVTSIGICNFVDSIIGYGILISMMGMGTLAIREIAQVKDDKKKLSSTFSSLVALNIITSLLVVVVLLVLAFFVPKLSDYRSLLLIGSSKVLFNALLVEWLYKGLENFRYITIRSLIIKVLYVVSVFIFVRNSDDYIEYFVIHVVVVIINALINIAYSRNYACFSIKDLHILKYLSPFFILGIYQLLTSMYTSFNVTYLGFACDTTEVGYYTTAVKLYTLILAVFTAFTGVMMPRLSSLLAQGNKKEFIRLTNESVDVLFACVFPLIVIGVSFTDSIIRLIAGPGYEGAIAPMKIIMPLLLVIGYEQILVVQMLMPMKKDKAVLLNSIIGATVGLLLNIIIVPHLRSVGSALVWIVSEFVVLFMSQYFVNKYISFCFPWKKLLLRLIVSLPILFFSIMLGHMVDSYIVSLTIGVTMVFVYYVIIEYYYYKNRFLRAAYLRLKRK